MFALTDPAGTHKSIVYPFGLVDLGGWLGFGEGPDLDLVGGAHWLRLRFNFETVLADFPAAANLSLLCFYAPQ